MTDFWERKKQELQQEGKLPMPRPEPVRASDVPWWAEGTQLHQPQQNAPQNPAQGVLELPGIVDGHDVSQAQHLKSESSCPMCGAGGRGKERLPGIMKPSATSAARCGSCGYVEGRGINTDGVISSIAISGVETKSIRQTADGGSRQNSTHMGASAADMAFNESILRQSESGKVLIGR